jgi:hypothetical protein
VKEKQTILSDFSSLFFPYNASTEGGEEKQTIFSDFSSFFFPTMLSQRVRRKNKLF